MYLPRAGCILEHSMQLSRSVLPPASQIAEEFQALDGLLPSGVGVRLWINYSANGMSCDMVKGVVTCHLPMGQHTLKCYRIKVLYASCGNMVDL